MAHLFSSVHYSKHKKPNTEFHYHGDACEFIMQEGIGLSARIKAARMMIGLKRNSLQTIQNTNRYGFTSEEMKWLKVEEARKDPRSIRELQNILHDLEFHMEHTKLSYQCQFMISRNFDPEHIALIAKWGKERIARMFPTKTKNPKGLSDAILNTKGFVSVPETWDEYKARTKGKDHE